MYAPAVPTGPRPSSGMSVDPIDRPRVPALSYFFPAHDESENVEPLVAEALAELPRLAERFEVICVDDGSTDGTGAIADRLSEEHPEIVRVVRHSVNRGYGAALRSGFGAARHELVCFTDGDRQFQYWSHVQLLLMPRRIFIITIWGSCGMHTGAGMSDT